MRKKLGFWMAVSLVMGNMIGSGIFLLPASLGQFGSISLLGWVFSTAGALLLALVFASLSRDSPSTGGPYAYARDELGSLAGFLTVWGYWVSIWAANAAIAAAFAGYVGALFPGLQSSSWLSAAVALFAIWLLTIVNVLGVRKAGFVQLLTTGLKIIPLLMMMLIGVLYFDADNLVPFNASTESNFQALTATAALTLWAFLGLECATVPAESIDNPRKTIPRATLAGTIFAAIIYIGATLGIMGVLPAEALSQSTAPFADAASKVWGESMRVVVAAGAAVAVFGALNGWILSMGQCAMAAARDGVFPGILATQSRWGTPAMGLVIGSGLSSILLLLNYTRRLVDVFTFIILLATMTVLVPYVFATMAEFRRVRKAGAQAWRRGVITLTAFAFSIWAIAGAGREIVYWGFILLLSGLPIYAFLPGTRFHPGGNSRM